MRYKQFCALARAAELLAERWTLLIVRELLIGPQRFGDLRAGLGNPSTSVLARRLAALEMQGLIRRTDLPSPASATVYELTANGAALRPAVYELAKWGGRFVMPPRRGEMFDPRWLIIALDACARKKDSPPHRIQLLVPSAPRDVAIHLEGGSAGTTVRGVIAEADAVVRGDGRAVMALATGLQTPSQLVAAGVLATEGRAELVEQVPLYFDTEEQRRAAGMAANS